MKKILIIIYRLIGLPFFMALALIGVITLWLKYVFNFILYGGEVISYTKKTERKTINDVFEKVQEMIDSN